MSTQNQIKKTALVFIKEVAKYFMDFLETDFHRQRTPKRSIRSRNSDNLLVGLNLNKYPSFNSVVWKAINKGFDKNSLNTIAKGVYKTNIPKNLIDLIKLQAGKISQKQIGTILSEASVEIEKSATLYKNDYEKAFTTALENISKIVRTNLVLPFVGNLEKPLEGLELGDENSVYLMEEELTNVLTSSLENKTSEVLKRILAKETLNISNELKQVFDLDEVKNTVIAFFEAFKVADLFSELFEMDRNKNILDKQDFYLYFCDITFNKAKYPIFYIPFSFVRQNDVLSVEFDSQVYINKKALEYIVQEYNEEKGSKGSLKSTSDRIIYLAQHQDDFRDVVNKILNEVVNFFELDSTIDISSYEPQTAKSLWTRISNTSYIALFDKSDEALVNDYEEIIQKLSEEDSVLAAAFNILIEDFIHKNPEAFNPEIEEEWDSTPSSDRLVFSSPIPLNGEQLQILSAIKKDKCKYITVEGPPGTGKSHTITAIVFDTILKGQSVLVLSDKKEALDVVENKITDTMNKVRHDKNFQNPILRLGKTGSTYSQILATSSIENIKTHYRAVKKDYGKLEEDIEKLEKSVKEDLEAEILSYENIDIQEIHELFDLENRQGDIDNIVDLSELLIQNDSSVDIEELRNTFNTLTQKLLSKDSDLLASLTKLGIDSRDIDTLEKLNAFTEHLRQLTDIANKLREVYGEKTALLGMFSSLTSEESNSLTLLLDEYQKIKSPLLGFLFKGKQVAALDLKFKKAFPDIDTDTPHEKLREFEAMVDILSYANELINDLKPSIKIDCVKAVHFILQDEDKNTIQQEMTSLQEDINFVKESSKKYPKNFDKLGIRLTDLKTLTENNLTRLGDLDFNSLVRYVTLKQKLEKEFQRIPELNYSQAKKDIEELVTTQMTYIMDGRLVNFYDQSRSDAKTLRDIIRKKQRFPKDEFLKLKEAFPCILAGIRDYAEYIPLEPEIFDLVVIDEASQVSIAQAFPALLRAKKVLILGDKRQFSNVKSAQVRTATNREYLNDLERVFKDSVSTDQAKLSRLSKFNIKTSILEFFEFISNYHTQLLKHFRGYKETISYSNRYFYQNNLQVMKIRGKNIDDVLKFSFIKHDGKEDLYPNTNSLEGEFIINELKKLKEVDSNSSVCIITPHTNQQKLLMEMISKLPERDFFFDKLQLKIMTFDTCQGEERDIVFYSMVATENSDRLWGVFIKDLSQVDIEEDGQIKAQRLNVGFSRAKERMHFVLSKPLDKFSGSVGEALRHYYNALEEGKKEPLPNEVDPNSPKEKEVLNWITQTTFWQDNFPENLMLKPQFELGKYLKQLDKTYTYPNYKVDFLLVYKDPRHNTHKIIIEYDGFEEHFRNIDEVNEYNYTEYYSDDDVYRQKVLESYGYKFLRINRFNSGEDPIQTINTRIENLVKNYSASHKRLSRIYETIENLQNGQMKECPKCNEVRSAEDFKDSSLITGYGRFCKYCKGNISYSELRSSLSDNTDLESDDKTCPRCNSKMILRSGRYGKFYGCSRFPYCRGTRQYN